jgi:apolipoprotein N-acyltransferase
LSLFGIYGLDLLIMLFNYALALALLAQLTGSLHPAGLLGHRGAALAIVSLLVIGWIGLSLVLAMAEPEDRATVRVAAIQPNLPRAAHRDPGTAAATPGGIGSADASGRQPGRAAYCLAGNGAGL